MSAQIKNISHCFLTDGEHSDCNAPLRVTSFRSEGQVFARFFCLFFQARRRLIDLHVVFSIITATAAVLFLFSRSFAEDSALTQTSQTTLEQFSKTGTELVSAGRLDDAIRVLEDGIRVHGANPTLLNEVGVVFNLKGKKREAEHYFLRALAGDPKFSAARKNLAITYFESGKFRLATPQLEELTLDPKTQSVAFLFLGMIAEGKKQDARAAGLFDKSGDLALNNPRALLSFASSLNRLHNAERARLLLDRLSALPDVGAPDWLQAGTLYLEFGHYQRALDCYDKAKAMNPRLAVVDYQRALVLQKLGRSEEALETVQHPGTPESNASALNRLAHLAEDSGEINLALQAFHRAAEIEPSREENYLDYSTLCMNYHNYPLALEIIDVGLFYSPNSYRLRVQRGAVLAELGKFAEAEQDFRTASELQTDNREALICLAQLQFHDRSYEDAVLTLRTATDKYPDDFHAHYYYALVLFQQGDNAEKVLREINRSIALNNNFAKSHFLLGKIYLDRDTQFAIKEFQTCLRLDPDHVSAKYQLGRLLLRIGRREEGKRLLAQVKDQKVQDEQEREPTLLVRR